MDMPRPTLVRHHESIPCLIGEPYIQNTVLGKGTVQFLVGMVLCVGVNDKGNAAAGGVSTIRSVPQQG